MYTYSCKILRIVDGDTVDVDIDLGFGVWMHRERVRMYGIDTPESRTSDPEEKVYGKLSKQFVKDNLPIGSMKTLVTHKDNKGKFGRILGDFLIEGKSLGKTMVDKSLAVVYNGEDKAEIQMKHLLNRNTLLHEGTVTVDDFN